MRKKKLKYKYKLELLFTITKNNVCTTSHNKDYNYNKIFYV